jgi:hypothetical protein
MAAVLMSVSPAYAEQKPFATTRMELNEMIAEAESNTESDKGLWYDKKGNIYCNSNYYNQNFLDETNEVINPSTYYGNFSEMAEKYERGETLTFKSKAEYLNFLEFYNVQYNLKNVHVNYYHTANGGIISASLAKDQMYDRDAVVKKIIDKFGLPESEDPYEKIYQVCLAITEMDYNLEDVNTDLTTSLDKNSGVCWQYAKSASVLLNESGVYTEIVFGILGDDTETRHMWFRSLVDGKWVYADPTLCKSFWLGYSNINYSEYMRLYTIDRNIK